MGVLSSPEALLYTAIGGLIFWVFKIIATWVKTSTDKRRKDVDERAALMKKTRLLTESLHEHRVMMIQSGKWTQETLPDFTRDDTSE